MDNAEKIRQFERGVRAGKKELLDKLTKIVYPKVVCGSLTMASVHRTMKLKKLLEEYK